MPQEPDNTKMEELLKAYAKKQREASGNPLHPATRRLLQDEVARIYPKSTASEVIPWYKLLFQFWPRVAFAVGLVVLIGSVFWALNRPPSDSQSLSLARNETEAFRAAPPANAELRDAEQPVRLQSPSDRRGFSLAENAPAPATTPAPRPVLRAPSPTAAPRVTAESEVALAEKPSQKAVADKRKADSTPKELAASETRDQFYRKAPPATTAPAAPLATAPPAQQPAPSRMDSQLAKNAPRSIQPSSRLEKDNKQVAHDGSSPLSAGKSLDTLSVAKEDESLLTKKEASLGVPMLTPSSAGASGAPAGLSQTLLFSSAASTWTNMASANLQSWSFQSQSAFGGGRGGGIGGAAAAPAPADANGRLAGENESDFVGSFGNIGGDGRFARSRAQADRATRGRIAPTTSPAPAEPSQSDAKNLAAAGVNSPSPQNNATVTYRYFSDSDRALYAQKDQPAVAAGASGPAQVPVLKVLDSFQLVQNGDTIQLVDADGSVYEGKLQVVENPARRLERERVELQKAPAKPNAIVAQQVETLGRQNAAAVAVTNSLVFRASGLNRSLGQTVVVNGRLERQLLAPEFQNFGAVVAPQAPGQTPSGDRGISTEAIVADQPVANGLVGAANAPVRISGTATIGGTNQIRLEAIPSRR